MSTVKELRRVSFFGDAAWRQKRLPVPDDLSAQDPDWIFLGELAQVSEAELNEPIKRVLYRIGGPVRDTADITIHQTVFLRPKQTQFVLVKRGDGMRSFERYDPRVHGEWEQIPDTGMTPSGCIQDIFAHSEEFPAIIHQFFNERKKRGGASKTHWHPDHHPTPRRR